MVETTERIELLRIHDDGRIEYRKVISIIEDGNFIGEKKRRGVMHPGDDISRLPYSELLDDIKPAVWNQKRVDAYKDKRKALKQIKK